MQAINHLGGFLFGFGMTLLRVAAARRSSASDLVNHIAVGVLMGFGGVMTLGCTIGQGLSGVSTLATSSIIALAAIISGCVAVLKYEYWRFDRSPAWLQDDPKAQ